MISDTRELMSFVNVVAILCSGQLSSREGESLETSTYMRPRATSITLSRSAKSMKPDQMDLTFLDTAVSASSSERRASSLLQDRW